VAPDNDFASFEATAKSIAAGVLPPSFKRGPVLPALMAMVAPLTQSGSPYLHAALLINAAVSLVSLALLFAVSRRLAGGAAATAACALYASSTQFGAMALEPLVEPVLGCAVLVAVYLYLRGSRWMYAAAGIAALARPETGLLIGVLALADLARATGFGREQDFSSAARGGGRDFLSRLRQRARVAHEAGSWQSWLRPLLFGGLACIPAVVWALLGAAFDQGADTYSDMWEGMDFALAPTFIERSVREPFMGLYRSGDLARYAVIGVPLFAGVTALLRKGALHVVVLGAWWTMTVAAVVRFGADKARYVYPSYWLPLVVYSVGLTRLVCLAADFGGPRPSALSERLHEYTRRLGAPLRAASMMIAAMPGLALLAWSAETTRTGLVRIARFDSPYGEARVDFALALVALACLGLALAVAIWSWSGGFPARGGRERSTSEPAGMLAALAGTALASSTLSHRSSILARGTALLLSLALAATALPLVSGGVHGRQRLLTSTYYDNYETGRLIEWLSENALPSDGVLMQLPQHFDHVAGTADMTSIAFSDLDPDVDDIDGVVRSMRSAGVAFVAYTWRPEPETASSHYYYRKYRTDLNDLFADGEALPGLEHVATLEPPDRLLEWDADRRPVQIYRLAR